MHRSVCSVCVQVCYYVTVLITLVKICCLLTAICFSLTQYTVNILGHNMSTSSRQVPSSHTHVHTKAFKDRHTCVNIHSQTCIIYVCTLTQVHIHNVHTHTHTHIDTVSHTHTHAHTRTHTHTAAAGKHYCWSCWIHKQTEQVQTPITLSL